jgi:hypothetical protein
MNGARFFTRIPTGHRGGGMSEWGELEGISRHRGDALVLYLGRKHCGVTHRKLSQKAEIDYASAATAVRRFSARVGTEREIATLAKQVMDEMNNEQS